jgi:DNA-directed RNA polymerase beta subunit
MQEISKQVRSIEQLEIEIKAQSQYMTASIIIIGQALNEAKELLPHGEWGAWLRDKVQFSQSTANNFMRVAREIPAHSFMTALPYTKALALLDVPADQRERFAEENNPNERSAAALRKAIKERKEAEAARDAAQAEARALKASEERQMNMTESLNEKCTELASALEEAKFRIEQQPEVITETVTVAPDDYESLKAQAKSAESLRKRAEAAEAYAAETEAALREAQNTVQRARMAQIDADARVADDPIALDAFRDTCKAFLATLYAAPHMAGYFREKSPDDLRHYEAATNSVLQWAKDTHAAIIGTPRPDCIVIAEGGVV